MPRHDRILGRSDDGIKYRAVNIYPGQVDELLSLHPEVGSEYQIHLERRQDGREYMIIKAERGEKTNPAGDEALAARISRAAKAKMLVSVEVQLVDFASLPRSERKTRRIFDQRFD
jgi:phenylacetate-CoA ligase